jgi:ClpP class serine protease
VLSGAAAGIPKKRPRGYLIVRALGADIVQPAPRVPAPGQGVAILQIRGVMTHHEEWSSCGEAANYDEIGARFVDAHRDPGVGAVLLDAETPGGDVPGIEETSDMMVAAALASEKPTLGYVGALCASGGVWLLSRVCTHGIYAHPSARLGSVGCVIGHRSYARHDAEHGIDSTLIRNPPGKMNPNEDELLDDLGRARLQTVVDEVTARFVAAVASARGIDPAVILSWNGDMFTGPAAIAAGLADGLGSLETTIAIAASLAGYREAA